MQFHWEQVSYKINNHKNYVKFLIVTFITGVANLDLRREIMFWFKMSQLQKSSGVEIKCMPSRLGDGFETLSKQGFWYPATCGFAFFIIKPGVKEGDLRSSTSGCWWFYFTQQLLKGWGKGKDNSGSNFMCTCRGLRSHFPSLSAFTTKLQGGMHYIWMCHSFWLMLFHLKLWLFFPLLFPLEMEGEI